MSIRDRFALSVALLAASAAGTAHAATLNQSGDLGSFTHTATHSVEERYGFSQPRTTTVTSSISDYYGDTSATFDLFDPTLGTLTGVQIRMQFSNLSANITVSDGCITQRFPVRQNRCSDSSSVAGRLDYGLDFSNLTPVVPVLAPSVNSVNDTVLSIDYAKNLSDGNSSNIANGAAFFDVQARRGAADLAAFTGTGTFDVNMASFWFNDLSTTCTGNPITAFGQVIGFSDIETCFGSASLTFRGSVSIGITYAFDEAAPPPPPPPAPVPLPAGGALLIGGLVAFAALRRRKS
ncbi:MAG: VPLPA-CTERM sorting domain-containing protein [Pseudomonadota bacterium]